MIRPSLMVVVVVVVGGGTVMHDDGINEWSIDQSLSSLDIYIYIYVNKLFLPCGV
jgi:hypothetical protein